MSLTHTTELRRCLKFIEKLREVLPASTSITQVAVLLCTATESGIDQSTLIKRLNLPKNTASTVIANFSELTASKEKGPGFLENRIDPMNLVIRLPTLTEKGEKMLNKASAAAWGAK
jgi:DNA-binding MarR family transcriptional regulator